VIVFLIKNSFAQKSDAITEIGIVTVNWLEMCIIQTAKEHFWSDKLRTWWKRVCMVITNVEVVVLVQSWGHMAMGLHVLSCSQRLNAMVYQKKMTMYSF
jgi:hypothetical protein